MISQNIDAQLSKVTYSEAIQHYNNLKKQFLNQYSIVANISAKEAEKDFYGLVASEINSEGIAEQELLTRALFEDIKQSIVEKMTTTTKNRISLLKNQTKSKSRKAKQDANFELQNIISALISEEEMFNHVMSYISAYGGENNGFDISDILNQVRSFRNRFVLDMRKSANYYIRSTKGFFREALIHQAFYNLAERIDNIPDKIIHAGTIKNEQNVDTVYDEYISFFNNVKQDFQTTVNMKVGEGMGFGIQSKSWQAPWERIGAHNSYYRYSMGNKGDLLAAFSTFPNQSWVNAVYFLEKNLITAIGKVQVGFSTGKNFYWTADLISNMRQAGYYFAFVYNKQNKPTKATSWQLPNF